MLMATSCLCALVFLCATQVLLADTIQVTNVCTPLLLNTHGKPIHVGCSHTCSNGHQVAKVTQTDAECTNISSETAQKMQPFLGYICPVGRCSEHTCVLNGLSLECWYANSNPSRHNNERQKGPQS
ncbi:evasin P1181-like [Dermacentor variabilis]|uniref:evasin P1181-like n=1 Tax=Dermacentor variabilis TaxID=34621 RepID=UPI003F5C4B22